MNTKNENIKAMEDKIHTINNRIDSFQEKLDKIPKVVNSEFAAVFDDLRSKRSNLESKFETFKGATDSAYQDLQTGFEMAWEDLNIAYDSAKERFEREASC